MENPSPSNKQAAATDPSVAEKDPARNNRHWQGWEIGYLLAMATDGRDLEAIAAALERSAIACRTELDRLIAGRADCPADYAASLEKAHRLFAPPPAATGKPQNRTPSPTHANLAEAIDYTRAQYRELIKANDRLAHVLAGCENLLCFGLAHALADGDIRPADVTRFLGPDRARLLTAMGRELREARSAAAPLFIPRPTEAAAEPPTPAGPPLVHLGHARDLTDPQEIQTR